MFKLRNINIIALYFMQITWCRYYWLQQETIFPKQVDAF